ncbi:MAG TPA: HEAT repeat domain-containing protein [Thermoanaerobaculia bacterium]|nr:HEAT repeat domain-containing protein [Thermoanaerobaculia bacterium]
MSSTSGAIQVIEFVRALALAWKNLAAYPPTHPAVASSLDIVRRRLDELRGPAGEVTLGISNDGLVYGTSKIDIPAAQKLAQALFQRGVAVMRLGNETTTKDIEIFLRVLGAGAPSDQKRAMWDDLTAAGVMNINLQPVNYSALQVTDHIEEEKKEDRSQRAESLWDQILQALLENRFFSARLRNPPVHIQSADELARMMAQYVEVAANVPFDPDATFGIRIPTREDRKAGLDFIEKTVGQYIAEASGMKKQNSLEQAVQLLRSLAEPLRGAVLRAVAAALAQDEGAGTLLREFASELPTDEVLDALRYLSSMGKLSNHATMLLEALTNVEASTRAQPPTDSVVADLVKLFGEDDVDRFNPADHRELLSTVAIHIPKIPPEALTAMELLGDRTGTVEHAAITRQLAVVLMDLVGELGGTRDPHAVLSRLEVVIRSHMAGGDFNESLVLIEQLQEIAKSTRSEQMRSAIQESLARLATGETIQALVDMVHKATPDKVEGIQRLAAALGVTARRSLLVALADEKNMSRRRRLFDFIASLGPTIVPDAISFLGDDRWFVVRNMVALLRAVRDQSSLPQVRNLAHHPDLRVRMEAIKSLFALDSTVPRSLLDDLVNDPDPKVAETAITLLGNYGIKEGVEPLLRVVSGNDVLGARRVLRIKAIRALGEIGEPRALQQLDRFFKTGFLPWPAKEERYAAWESIYHYPADVRQTFIEKGLRSSDPQVRAICARFAGT